MLCQCTSTKVFHLPLLSNTLEKVLVILTHSETGKIQEVAEENDTNQIHKGRKKVQQGQQKGQIIEYERRPGGKLVSLCCPENSEASFVVRKVKENKSRMSLLFQWKKDAIRPFERKQAK